MRERGQIFTTDMAFAVMLLGVVLFISAGVYGDAMEMTRSYVSRHSLERRADDIADALVKTPGTPADWEENLDELETPGFAKIEERDDIVLNYVEFRKVGRLSSVLHESNWDPEGNASEKIEESFGDNKFEIRIKREGYSRSFWPDWNLDENFPEARVKSPEVASVERLVLGTAAEIRAETGSLDFQPPSPPTPFITDDNFYVGDEELDDYDWYVYVENLGEKPPNRVNIVFNDEMPPADPDVVIRNVDMPGAEPIDGFLNRGEYNYMDVKFSGQNRDMINIYIVLLSPDDDPEEISQLIKERPYTLQVRVWR